MLRRRNAVEIDARWRCRYVRVPCGRVKRLGGPVREIPANRGDTRNTTAAEDDHPRGPPAEILPVTRRQYRAQRVQFELLHCRGQEFIELGVFSLFVQSQTGPQFGGGDGNTGRRDGFKYREHGRASLPEIRNQVAGAAIVLTALVLSNRPSARANARNTILPSRIAI